MKQTLRNRAIALAVAFASPMLASAATLFSDDFSTSTVDAASPLAPTSTSTDYALLSSKSRSPAPTVGTGHLDFGIAATTSGHIEAQALFTTAPVTLAGSGDYIRYTLTFTDTAGLLTQSGMMGFGLYNSGGVAPLAGGMNGTAVSGTAGVTGGVQNWQGYASRLWYTGSTSKIVTRPQQTATTGINQDLITEGSGSQSYQGAVTLHSLASTLVLSAGAQYTEVMTISMTGANTLQIDSSLYTGADSSGTLLFSDTASGVTGANFFNGFDGLAFGWRATANTSATTIDVNQISIDSNVTVPEPGALTLLGCAAGLMVFSRRVRR